MRHSGSGVRHHLSAAAAATVVAALLAGCASSSSGGASAASPTGEPSSASASASTSAPAPVDPLASTSWALVSYRLPAGTTVSAEKGSNASLDLGKAGEVAGSTGCNRFTGTYEHKSANLSFTVGPMTQAACTSAALAAQEKAVLAGLKATRSYLTQDTGLALVDASGGLLLIYKAVATTIVGPTWHATGINNGKNAVVTTASTEKATAIFDQAGSVTGSGGCNNYSGPYKTTGAHGIAIGPLAGTMMACEADVSTTEAHFLAAMQKATAYRIGADGLTLVDATGATMVHFVAG
jgi:heat shock protein HslJ